MIDYGGPERRQFERRRAHFITNYKIIQPPEVVMNIGSKAIEAVMLDLSVGGMALVTKHNIPVGTSMRIDWTLINPYAETDDRIRKFEVQAEVRHNEKIEEDEYRLGITFVNVGKGDQKAIEHFVKSNRRGTA